MDILKGRTALVTGSSQGLGRVVAMELAKLGVRVIVNCRGNRDKAEAVAAEIRQAGGEAQVRVCDVGDETAVNALFVELEKSFGSIDILVNNARLDPWNRKPEMSEGEWFDQVIRVNLKSALLTSLAFCRQSLPGRWGRIVNVSSVRAFRPAEPTMIAYGVSKVGMHALTRSFAENGAARGITANTVAPGMVITENINARLSPEKYAEESAAIPLGRGGTSEEIADAVIFAIRNGYVTGETININGGMYYAP